MKYKNAEEITKAFIKKGWSPETKLHEIRLKEKPTTKLYIMENTGNIYAENGKIYAYNVPTISQEQRPTPEIIPPLKCPYYYDDFIFV